jgi:hypothetical protein
VGLGLGVLEGDGSGLIDVLGVGQKLTAATATIPATTAAAARISARGRLPPLLDFGEPEVSAGAVGGLRFSADASDVGGSWRRGSPVTVAGGGVTSAASSGGGGSLDVVTPADWADGLGADFGSGVDSRSLPLRVVVVDGAGACRVASDCSSR